MKVCDVCKKELQTGPILEFAQRIDPGKGDPVKELRSGHACGIECFAILLARAAAELTR